MLQIVRKLWSYYVAWRIVWIRGRQWSKMAAEKMPRWFFWQFQIKIVAKNHIGKYYAKNPTTAYFVT